MKATLTIILPIVLLIAGCAGIEPDKAPVTPARPPQAAAPEAPVQLTPQEQRASLPENRIFFPPGGTQVDANGRHKLEAHATALKGDSRLVVTLVGMTDDLGSRAYKLAIAEQRVNAVFQELRKLGVPARQMRRYAVGMEEVVRGCVTTECRSVMRRVELRYP